MIPLDLTLTGGQVLRRGALDTEPLHLGSCVIAEMSCGQAIDLSGYLILPGIVDVHGDAFERHLAPRRGAMKDRSDGLVATEAELAANGITTGFLAQFYSWEGGLRGPDFADSVFTALAETRGQLVTDLRGQLRFETHMLDDFNIIPDLMARWGIDYIVFNDHLPHEKLAQGKRPPRLVAQALKAARNPDRHFDMMVDLHTRSVDVPKSLDILTAQLLDQGIRIGSHDDTTAADREDWRRRGAYISEFPETLEAAQAAREAGDGIVLGAPNLVRGGSHKGNVSALELVNLGLCDALASDYHYPSLRRAALLLANSGVLSLADAWALISSGPARLMGLEDRGRLEPGLRADLVILEGTTRRVAATMAGGRFSYLNGDVAARFIKK